MADVSSFNDAAELVKTLGGPSAVAMLGWWMRSKFANVEKAGEKRMQVHEKQDERRHRENLVRFAKINTKLEIDDANETNGDHRHDEDE